ncbi:MAG TPA: hypothetical protein VFL13_11460 [Candidatus Baltobacteraceae bacterium]|nr:hypothetical protein [Candidatus Baltobacteraceae bacterium]
MKIAQIADAVTAGALDTAWLYRTLEPASAFGRRAFESIEPFRPGEETAAAARSEHLAKLADAYTPERLEAMREALRISPDPLPAIARASMGETLDDPNLLELLRFLDAAKRVEFVPFGEGAARVMRELEPGRAGKFGFYLSDSLSSALAKAREHADLSQAAYDSARGRLAQRVGAQLDRDDAGSGEFIVMRAGVSALPEGVRVVREAPTYFLCELELDEETLAALARRDDAAQALAQAEQHERERLTGTVRAALAELEALLEAMSSADVDLAQARFVQTYACTPAQMTQTPQVRFESGTYLPLAAQLAAQGRRYEPISVDLHEAAAITGPNMGGKSAALRACGFIALLAAFGIPVPAQNAACAIFDDISWLGTGAHEDTGGLLSSYASEVVRLTELLARPARRQFLLLDEFARTTTPHEGGALLVAVLRALKNRGRLAFAATHLEGVATHAGVAHYAVRGLRELPAAGAKPGDLAAALDALSQNMDYSIVPVDGGYYHKQSDALALAQLLGLDEDIVADAKEASWTP